MPRDHGSLRVLEVAARFFPYVGGVETHLREVAPRLTRAGVEVSILTTDPSGKLPVDEVVDGVPVHRVPAWPRERDYYFAPALYRVITRQSWDLVHCHGYHNFVAPMAMLAARRAGIPYIMSFHSGGDTSRVRKLIRPYQWRLLRPMLANAAGLVCVSEWEASFFAERLGLPLSRFTVIPNGAHHLPGENLTPGPATDESLIVSVGRLESYKGHQCVIAALPLVLREALNTRLRIVGTGPYEATLRKLAAQLGVAQRVEIKPVPPGDDAGMATLLRRASVVTLLSEHEAQGIVVLEALALKRPTLVAATSALNEFANRGLARAVSAERSPAEVSAAILREFRDPLTPGDVTLPEWDDCAEALRLLYQSLSQRSSCAF